MLLSRRPSRTRDDARGQRAASSWTPSDRSDGVGWRWMLSGSGGGRGLIIGDRARYRKTQRPPNGPLQSPRVQAKPPGFRSSRLRRSARCYSASSILTAGAAITAWFAHSQVSPSQPGSNCSALCSARVEQALLEASLTLPCRTICETRGGRVDRRARPAFSRVGCSRRQRIALPSVLLSSVGARDRPCS